ncbi:co-chaperone GrpE [Marvinbryantia formatexigens DSM 14469]|uniref:Protein GrpE n=1 Tax=Marvinbryantia formatexigens DSM 14469 TaxID=478749 RepID=C6LGJ1_9FIRM|nr:co-chaperone GrpE [Marvinbryantia formatexigens DSM 14469]
MERQAVAVAEENMEKDMDEAIEKNTQEEEAPETEEASRQQKASEPAEETEEAPQKESKKDKKDAQIEELQDRVKRQMAEFENFRKRSEKEKSKMFEMGAKSVIEQLLPIVDNFERGLAAVSEEAKEDAFVSGMDKVYRQMTEMLDKLGVKPIEAVGCEFNPDFHNAVMHVEEEDTAENTITEEFLKGYTYKDQVVRHSMVKVAN